MVISVCIFQICLNVQFLQNYYFITESLRAISEAIEVALDIAGITGVDILLEEHLEKKTSKPAHGSGTNFLQAPTSLPRNVSETQLLALKNAGKNRFHLFNMQLFYFD